MTRLGVFLLFLCGLAACNEQTLDLDRTAPASSSPQGSEAPLVADARFLGVWVDDQRVFWISAIDAFNGNLESCLKEDCAHTRLRYSTNLQSASIASVAAGHSYWVTPEGVILSCAANGCDGKPTRMAQDPGLGNRLFANQDYVYWASDLDLYRCQASGCAATPEVVATNTPSADYLTFDANRVYWIDPINSAISSAPADGSELPKRLVELPAGSAQTASLAIGNEHLYWTVGGQVLGCQIATCSAASATLLAVANTVIEDLKVDDAALYFLEGGTIHSCSLAGCEQSSPVNPAGSRVGQGIWSGRRTHFALDANYVYWLEKTGGDLATAIRRTAK